MIIIKINFKTSFNLRRGTYIKGLFYTPNEANNQSCLITENGCRNTLRIGNWSFWQIN